MDGSLISAEVGGATAVNGRQPHDVSPLFGQIAEAVRNGRCILFLGAGVVAFSRDGRNLAAGTESGAVIVWDTQTGQRRGVLRASNGAGASTEPTWMVLFTADSRHILSAGDDGKVRLWDWQPQTDAVVATFTGLSQSVALSPDRRWLSAGGANHTTVLIRCQACAPLEQLKADARAASRPLTREQQRRYLPKHEPKGPY
jgi:WD40 repeat protein